MKFKSTYIYIILILALVAVVIIISQSGQSNNPKPPSTDITEKAMPDDDVHKQFKQGGGMPPMGEGQPSKMNVSKEFLKKMEDMKALADKNPPDPAAIREYAQLLFDAHKQKESIPYFEKLLKINPKDTEVLFNLTFAAFNMKDYNKAEEYTNKILQIDKNNLQATFNLGAIAAEKGDKEKAREIWTKLVKNNPGSESAEIAKSALDNLK